MSPLTKPPVAMSSGGVPDTKTSPPPLVTSDSGKPILRSAADRTGTSTISFTVYSPSSFSVQTQVQRPHFLNELQHRPFHRDAGCDLGGRKRAHRRCRSDADLGEPGHELPRGGDIDDAA